MNKLKLVRIKWLDAASSPGWTYGGKDEAGLEGIDSVGWLVHKDSKQVQISLSISDSGRFWDVQAIPTHSIVSIKTIGEK